MRCPGLCRMSERAWLALRAPFALSTSCVGYHVCEWETFDIGRAGCVLCSTIHNCGVDVCTDVVQTEDALVCGITGFCITTQNLMHGVSDNGICRPPRVSSIANRKTYTYTEIETHVKHLLVSHECVQAHQSEVEKLSSKFNSHVNTKFAQLADIFAATASAVKSVKCSRWISSTFDMETRLRLVSEVSTQLTLTIGSCCAFMPLLVRGCELRTLVYGLVYLMRTGITVHHVCCLPVNRELEQYLPSEGNLGRFFDFKAKNITDIENRFKYMFRTCGRPRMHRMGFHESV